MIKTDKDLAKEEKMITTFRNVILEDTITVYDILGPLCEILKERITYLCEAQEVPADIKAQLDTIIYASSRIDVDDLYQLRSLVQRKFGTYYIDAADQNKDGLVNINVVEKLKIKPPVDAFLTIRLKQLCKEKKFNYEFPEEIAPNFDQGMGNQFGGPQNPYDSNSGMGMGSNPYGPPPGNNPYGPPPGNNPYGPPPGDNPYGPPPGNNPYAVGNNNIGNDFDSYMKNTGPGGMGPGGNPFEQGNNNNNNNPYANNNNNDQNPFNGNNGGNPYGPPPGENPYSTGNNNNDNPFDNNNGGGNPYGGNPYS